MASKAQSFVDVVLGEAVHGSPVQRYEDMKAIASAVVNRANELGVSVKDVISAKGQFDAYGKSLPPGVEAFRALAEKAIADVVQFGPTHAGTFYATPAATKNLPSGLEPVTQTAGHVFFDDPQNRAIATAKGYITPTASVEQASYAPSAKTATVSQDPFDALFGGPETAPAVGLDTVGTAPSAAAPASSGRVGSIDAAQPAAWDGSFSSPVGAMTGRTTSGFGARSAPDTGRGRRGSSNHMGVDFSAAAGQAGYPAEAAAPGIVTRAGHVKGYGNVVDVQHPNGFTSRYGHLQSINVSVGDDIAAGTPVGKVGSSGNSSAPHLHFEIRDPLGQPVNPRSVTDFTNRSLSVTPSPRPSQDVASSFSSMAAAGPLGFTAATPDPARFGPADISPAASLASISRPGPDIDPARFGGAPAPSSQPSASRFGYDVASAPALGAVSGPVSPAGGYAAASAPAKSGGLGGLGGLAAKAAPDPSRFGPTQMASTPTTGRLSSQVTPSNATPMAASLSPVGMAAQSLSSPVQRAAEDAGYLTTHVNTTSVAPTAMGLLPSTAQAPVGSFSTFNPMPTDLNVLDKALNRLPTNPPLSLPNMPAIPSVVPPTVQPMVTPVAKQPVSPQTTASIPTPRPSFSAFDVYSGKAPAGYQAPATGGNLVSRDQFGNTHVTNSFGVTTVTDPSGRQMGNLSGLGKGIGNAFDKAMDHVTPGMIGSVVGGAIAGMPGAIVGGLVGNKMGGQQSGQKSGGLGGLGGFLSGLFGGGNSGNGGGGGSSSGRGGGSSGSRGGPPGADRDHAGN